MTHHIANFTCAVLLCLSATPAVAQGIGSGALARRALESHSLRLINGPAEDYPLCGRKLREVLPLSRFGHAPQVNFGVAKEADAAKVLPYLAKCAAQVMDGDSELAFLPFDEMKKVAIDAELRIDSMFTITFPGDPQGAVSLFVDSQKKLVRFKSRDGTAILSFRP